MENHQQPRKKEMQEKEKWGLEMARKTRGDLMGEEGREVERRRWQEGIRNEKLERNERDYIGE